MSRPSAAGPLDGLRVLDLSRILAGPYCAMMLADLGADVVKVERPGLGDPTRAWGPPFPAGESAYFLCANRGKRSIAVDLGDPAGVEVVRRLAARSDVVIENFMPGTAERLGIGEAVLREARPRLVYCAIAGYSPDGPDARRAGFDFAIQGEGGIMSVTGEPDGEPMKVGVAIADITAGMFAAAGVLAALRDAERTGRGRRVDVSLFDAQLAWLANRASEYLAGGVVPERYGNAHPVIVPYQSFRARDGFLILAIGTDDQFGRFCAEAGLGELAEDERFRTNPDRVANRDALVARLSEAIAARSLEQWLGVLTRARVPGGPVRSIPDALERAPHALAQHAHASIGALHTVRSPIAIDGSHLTAVPAPPLLGEHTAELLGELGYGPAERAELLRGACRNAG